MEKLGSDRPYRKAMPAEDARAEMLEHSGTQFDPSVVDAFLRVLETHPVVGEQILAPVPFLADVRRIVRHDHERWDGTGYPDGLRGPQIPLGSRIVLVVDAFHAMISDRPYRSAMPVADAYEELRANAGSQFDPAVVEALLAVLQRRPGV